VVTNIHQLSKWIRLNLELLGLMRRVNSVLNVEAYRHTRSRIISSYNNEMMYDTALALLSYLSDNCQNRIQINTVVVQQKEMERVGVEPLISS
jgi:hypothetical protein